MDYDVKDSSLAPAGKLKIEWAERQMDVLRQLKARFEKETPLKGVKIAACLHVTSETANLMRTLAAGGAEVRLCASNPLSTQDEVAASLVKDYNVPVFAVKGEDNKTYYEHLNKALDLKPNVSMDDGADLVSEIHSKRTELLDGMWGGSEETTTGVIRFKAMEKKGVLKYPIIAVNDSKTKHFFDNRYGTGQSTIDGILRATNLLLAGKTVVVAGYGWCGRGFATKAKGMGANVIVTEVDHLKAIEAVMDGFNVARMVDVVDKADLIVTLTGDINVVDSQHFRKMKDGCVVANSGHFDVEINKKALKELSASVREIRPLVEEFTLGGGKKVFLLAGGRLVNLACAEGHPASVMDMSFSNQSRAAEFIFQNRGKLENKVYVLPKEVDQEIASLKLASLGIKIDELTKEQKEYLESWEVGT